MTARAPASSRISLALASAVLVGAAACGGSELASGDTSVFLTVRNGAGAPQPFEIGIFPSAYGGALGDAGVTTSVPLVVRVQVDAGAAIDLGSIAIAAPPQGGATMVIRGQGRDHAGRVISQGEVTARIVSGKQSRATLTLMATTGVAGDGGVGDGGSLDAAAGSEGGFVDAALERDAAGDAPAVVGKGVGELCADANECTSGVCRDSVCCDRACAGLCRTCRAQGQPLGTCVELETGTVCRPSECRMANMILATFRCDEEAACVTLYGACASRVCNASDNTCM